MDNVAGLPLQLMKTLVRGMNRARVIMSVCLCMCVYMLLLYLFITCLSYYCIYEVCMP